MSKTTKRSAVAVLSYLMDRADVSAEIAQRLTEILDLELGDKAPGDELFEGAFECQVILKNGYRTQGAIGLGRLGQFRMLCPGVMPGPEGRQVGVIAEHFISPGEIAALILLHPVEPEKKPSIILG